MKLFKPENAGWFLMLATLGLLSVAAPGCRTTAKIKPVAWNLIITNTTTDSVQVDLVGATPEELSRFYDRLSMGTYWKPDGDVRKDADKMSKLLVSHGQWTVNRKDPKWRRWLGRGVKQVLVVADLPEKNALWKVPVSLDKGAWDAKHRTLQIEIQTTLIRITPLR